MREEEEMKKVLLGLFVLFVFPMGMVYGEEVVTSDKLSMDDVKGHLARQSWITLVELYGIHQEGSRATVYYKGKEPAPPFISKEGFQITEATLELVRFNSGKWFVTREGMFLKK
jgi:hypothetical protein